MGAIYLSARFALNGKRTPDGQTLRTNDDVRRYLLKAAGFGVVPFQAFGVKEDTGWFRLSVGAVSMAEIERGASAAARGGGGVSVEARCHPRASAMRTFCEVIVARPATSTHAGRLAAARVDGLPASTCEGPSP